MYNLKLVCEGPTDLEVFYALLDAHLLGHDYSLTMLQPDGSLYGGDAGPFGGGWKGVRGWCQSVAEGGGLEAVGALHDEVDLLVIHVDADIAADPELACACPCPPPYNTIAALERLVCDWLGLTTLPARVALWIPSMSTEAWVLSALYPAQAPPCLPEPSAAGCVECLLDPAGALLALRAPLVKRKDGKLKKMRKEYAALREDIAGRWGELTQRLWAASHLQQQLNRCLPAPESASLRDL